MSQPVSQSQPINSSGQIVAHQLKRAAQQASVATRRTSTWGDTIDTVNGWLFGPHPDRTYIAVVEAATSVPHVFQGTIEYLDTSQHDAPIKFQTRTACFVFPLAPTPDPNPGDFIQGKYVGEMTIAGLAAPVIAYC